MISIGQELPTVKLLTALAKKLEPVDDAFGEFSNISHPDKWKVIYFYPKDFTFICPTEILGFDSIQRSGEAVVYGGSVDNEHVKLAWKKQICHFDKSKDNYQIQNLEHIKCPEKTCTFETFWLKEGQRRNSMGPE